MDIKQKLGQKIKELGLQFVIGDLNLMDEDDILSQVQTMLLVPRETYSKMAQQAQQMINKNGSEYTVKNIKNFIYTDRT